MSTRERQRHWQNVYHTKSEQSVSWFQERPDISLDLIHATKVAKTASILDVGGGASRLVDALVAEGFNALSVLDVSEKALATSKTRLGAKGTQIQWIAADVTQWKPTQTFDVWHDRAALHFLIEEKDCAAYVDRVLNAVRIGGHVIIGTFALDGPERCSGLPVIRYDAVTLGELLGSSFALLESRRDDHQTPSGAIQQFQFSRFKRIT
jgi:2-polyprenyl-3-methyl-5-hydroxy-6-metoxy-1,4-benzoquinol methylase